MNNSVLITGSSKGFGRNLAIEFADRGYDLIIHGRNAKELSSLEELIASEKKRQVSSVIGDITSEDTLNQLIDEAKTRGINILVNNAGIYLKKEVEETSEQEFREIMETDFFAQIRLTKKILPLFIKEGGVIVNINSTAGAHGSLGESAYSAAKHALKGFSESLRYEVTKKGIKIMDIFLGAMKTQMNSKREDRDLLIDPLEAAKFIVQSCQECQKYLTVYPKEIYLSRCKYGGNKI